MHNGEGFDVRYWGGDFLDMGRRFCGMAYQLDHEFMRSHYEESEWPSLTVDICKFEQFLYDFPVDPWVQNEDLLGLFAEEGVVATLISPDLSEVTFYFESDEDWMLFKLKRT